MNNNTTQVDQNDKQMLINRPLDKKRELPMQKEMQVMVDLLKAAILTKVVYVCNQDKRKEYLYLISTVAMTAHNSVVYTRYMMFSLESEEFNDNRPLSELFLYFTDEMSDDKIGELVDIFINTFPVFLKYSFKQHNNRILATE